MNSSHAAQLILVMAVTTYLTRAGGIWLAALFAESRKLERFLHHLSGSTLAALAASVALDGDLARAVAFVAAAVSMFLTRSVLASLAIATLVAFGVRQVAA
jgi:uncharacterized membrane protein